MASIFTENASKLHLYLKEARILVVDDFQGMRTMLRNILKDAGGVNIDTAANAKEALALLKASSYDIILCDFNLGVGQNGQQLLEEARMRSYIGPGTIWIIVTAEKTNDLVMGAAESKPDGYILKPINLQTLESRLEKLLEKKRAMGGIEAAVKTRNYLRVIEACDKLRSSKPANLQDILRIKSEALMTLGRYEEAAQLFEAVLTIRDVSWAKTGLGKVSFHQKDYDHAASIFREVLAANRLYMEASDWLVKTMQAIGDTEQALKVLQEAVEVSPNSANRQKVLGETAYVTGDLDLAQTAFEKTIRISEFSPVKSPDVFAGLAKVFTDKKEPSKALNTLGQCRREFKDNPEALLYASIAESVVHQSVGDGAKAKAAMQQALQAKASMDGVLPTDLSLEMANALFKLGDKEAASQLLGEVVKNNHDRPGVAAKVQTLFEAAEMGDEGRELIAKSKEDVVNINNQGVLLAREEKIDDAIALLRQAAIDMPNSETVLMNLCGTLIAKMQKDGRDGDLLLEVQEMLFRVNTINPDNKKQHEYAAAIAALTPSGA